ncbi:MAG: CdaR family protein [candidate division WOR-3 bacterium]|nr:CdaR family protein [candidate division WOR-3 bacterium]
MQKFLKIFLNLFTTDPVRKIFALGLAFGLWLFVAIDGTYNYGREISVNYVNLPEHYVLVDSVARLSVVFTGKGKNLIGLWASPPRALCNLSEVVPGRNVFSTRDLIIPVKDVSINFEAKFITVTVDERVTKYIRPVIPVEGNPKNGYAILAIEIIDTVKIDGPKEILRGLKEITTESLSVSNRSASFEKNLKIKILSELIKVFPENIRVKVIIDSVAKATFTGIPLNILKNTNQRIRMAHAHIDTLIVSGAAGRIQKLTRDEIDAVIKVSDLVPGEYLLSPEIILPDFINLNEIKPQQIRVTVY